MATIIKNVIQRIVIDIKSLYYDNIKITVSEKKYTQSTINNYKNIRVTMNIREEK